jgi:hypothetical protein
MAATNYTPISLYYSSTATNTPSAGNLVYGELAINIADGKLYYKNPSNVVTLLAVAGGAITPITNNGVVYINGSGQAVSGSALTFDGSKLSVTSGSSSIAGLVTSGAAGSQGQIQFGSSQTTYNIQGGPDYLGNVYNVASGTSHQWAIAASEQMRLTSTGLGIGTSSPAYKVNAVVPSAADAFFADANNLAYSGYRIRAGVSGQQWAFRGGTSTMGLTDVTAGVDRVVVDLSGNLGLGVTPSAWNASYKALQVGQTGSFSNSTANTIIADNRFLNTSGSDIYLTTASASAYQLSSGGHRWYTAPSGTAGNAITFTQAMTLDASGQLLIKATSNSRGFGGSGSYGRLFVDCTGIAAIPTTDSNIPAGYSYGIFNSSLASTAEWLLLAGPYADASHKSGILLQDTYYDNNQYGGRYIQANGRALTFGITNNGTIYSSNQTLTEQMRLDVSGNLGLGVTPSAWSGFKAVQVQQGCIASNQFAAGNLQTFMGSNAYFDGVNYSYIVSGSAAARYAQNENSHIWFTAPSGTAGNAITFTQAMTLDASGRLGLGGVTSPLVTLDVGGTSGTLLRAGTNSGNGSLNFWPVTVGDGNSGGGGTNQNFVRIGRFSDGTAGIDAFQGGVGNASLAFGTFGTERMRIDSSGNLLVGTTSTLNSGKLSVNAAGTNGITCQVNDVVNPCFQAWSAVTSGNPIFVNFATEGTFTSRGSIAYNRGTGLVVYATTSDYRAKDIIGPVQDSGATIDALKVYEGQMKGATQSRPMLVAHEAQAITPYAVTGEKDAVKEDGTPDYQQMDMSSLVPLLIAEIQSLRIRITKLENKL